MGPITFVSAISREKNLKSIYHSMISSLRGVADLDVRWILVFDPPGSTLKETDEMIESSDRVVISKAIYESGPMIFGINQKNMGIDLIKEGFYHCFDDDNIVHPDFFKGISKAIKENPTKLAFVFAQRRWDGHGNLVPTPADMCPGKIDNSMFVVHKDLIGDLRYDPKHAGYEDGVFFSRLYQKARKEFVFIKDFLAYYNYLKHFPDGEMLRRDDGGRSLQADHEPDISKD